MVEAWDLAPGCTAYYLVLLVESSRLGSSAAGGFGGAFELVPDPCGASVCGEGQLPVDSATVTQCIFPFMDNDK